jgi:hypothetical protein
MLHNLQWVLILRYEAILKTGAAALIKTLVLIKQDWGYSYVEKEEIICCTVP